MLSGINVQNVRIRGWKLSLFSNPLYFTVFMCKNVIFPLKEAQAVKLICHPHSSQGFGDAAFDFPVDLKAYSLSPKDSSAPPESSLVSLEGVIVS